MTSRLTVEDLTLAEAVARHGSVGAAAKELLTTQPSASRRLAALERRLGVRLFERDTTGARPTPAGRELARQAARLLAEIDALPDQVLAATSTRSLSVGTIQALAPMVFTALSVELDDVTVHPEVDHGPVLIQQVHDGLLDAAVVTIVDQTTVPRGLHRTVLGISPLVLVLPDGAPPLTAGRRPFAGRPVLYSTFDRTGEAVRQRLSALGALPMPAPTIEAGLRIARHRRLCAVVPELAAHWYLAPGDRIRPSPVSGEVSLSLVARPPGSPVAADALERITAHVLGAAPAVPGNDACQG
ncbi:LysR family transcriptional regulator [Streptomyces sp. NPDC002734]|uniref:LysR family transcriptional regulator n=1 Tax=Streptomyces sp. NPDC002734 TaxID=3154426 RepID=UPI003326AF46